MKKLLILPLILLASCSKVEQPKPVTPLPIKVMMARVYQNEGTKVDMIENGEYKLSVKPKAIKPNSYAGISYRISNLVAGKKYTLTFSVRSNKATYPMFFSLDPKWNQRVYLQKTENVSHEFVASSVDQDLVFISEGSDDFWIKDVKVTE